MKKLIILFAAIVMMAAFTTKVMAQPNSNTTSNASRAEVLSAIGLVAHNPLEFGGFTSGALGTVVMSPLGVRTFTGGVILYATSITPTAASYTVSGAPNTSYAIIVPTTDQLLVHVGNSSSMPANTFTCSYSPPASTLSQTGTDAFTIGATLNVGSSQAPGLYIGTFNITIAY
jgi:hypothetical protein